jgi:hypothetical protein
LAKAFENSMKAIEARNGATREETAPGIEPLVNHAVRSS